MLPLPVFSFHRPRTLEEAVALLGELGDRARILAGGTDLLPGMKQGLFEPEHVVSIAGVEELVGVRAVGGPGLPSHVEIGAATKLATLAEHPLVVEHARALAEAAAQVGGPHHRAMGTLGGNLCLDTRCRWYNQTYFWRKALGFCLKKDGTVCHVVAGGQKCVAAASNDSGPVLSALEAEIGVASAAGERWIAAQDFYTADGIRNTVLSPGDLVTRVRLPVIPGRASAFEKLRRRGAIDFPLLSVAACADLAEDGALRRSEVVVSALGARPRRVRAAQKLAPGARPSAAVADALAEGAYQECRPLTNLDEDAEWRREMVRVLVRRALGRLGFEGKG